MIRYTIKSENWRIQPSVFLLDLSVFFSYSFDEQFIRKAMSNVSFLAIENFSGAELSIKIAESKSGPYIDSKLVIIFWMSLVIVYNKKYFTKAGRKKIELFSLPCRFLRIECVKGKLEAQQMRVFGFFSDQVEDFLGKNSFSLMVNQPQKILYDF